jgi:hypothetical protein
MATLAMGVSLSTLLFLGVVLLCPAVMFFGMNGMQRGGGHCGKHNHSDAEAGAETQPEQKAA